MNTYFEILLAAIPWSSLRHTTLSSATCQERLSGWDEVEAVAGVGIIPLIKSGLVDQSQV